jgi:hypothetical protein
LQNKVVKQSSCINWVLNSKEVFSNNELVQDISTIITSFVFSRGLSFFNRFTKEQLQASNLIKKEIERLQNKTIFGALIEAVQPSCDSKIKCLQGLHTLVKDNPLDLATQFAAWEKANYWVITRQNVSVLGLVYETRDIQETVKEIKQLLGLKQVEEVDHCVII